MGLQDFHEGNSKYRRYIFSRRRARVAENRGARERRSYEETNLVRSVSKYQKKILKEYLKISHAQTLSATRVTRMKVCPSPPCTASVPHTRQYVNDGKKSIYIRKISDVFIGGGRCTTVSSE